MLQKILHQITSICFRLKFFRRELLPKEGPALVMPNHVSFLDAILLFISLPKEKTTFVVNTEIAQKFSYLIKFARCLTVDPMNPFSMKEVIKRVEAGEIVVIFPEGRITTTGTLMKIYNGVAMIAMKTNAPIIPVILMGPEQSCFSRAKGTKKHLFPKITFHVFPALRPVITPGISNRLAKAECAGWLLRMLQESLFKAKQERETAENAYDMVLEAAKKYGFGKVIVEDPFGELTYRGLLTKSRVLGGQIKSLNWDSDVPVGLLMPTSNAGVVSVLSLCWAGKIPAVLNFSSGLEMMLSTLKTGQIKHILTSRNFVQKAQLTSIIDEISKEYSVTYLEDLGPKIGLVDKVQGFLEVLFNKPSYAEKSELILFTSGSESAPKGVVLTHRALLENTQQVTSVISFMGTDRLINPLPLFHAFGLSIGTMLPLFCGIYTYHYPSPLHYRVIPEIMYDKNITILIGTPTFLNGYGRVAHGMDFYTTRYVFSSGERLSPETRQLWQEKFGIRIIEGYGATEASPIVTLNTPLFFDKATVGRIMPGIEYKIEPVDGIEKGGNFFIKGPNLMKGYLREGKGFEPLEDWYDTGDVLSMDQNNMLTIEARLKRFAKISGEMVSLDTVEKWVREYSDKKQYGAVNLPDQRKGEKIILYTTDSELTVEALRGYWSSQKLPMLALPNQVVYMKDLPMLASGKINYRELNKIAKESLSA